MTPELKRILDQMGVVSRKPDAERPTPTKDGPLWTPTYRGEEPPF